MIVDFFDARAKILNSVLKRRETGQFYKQSISTL